MRRLGDIADCLHDLPGLHGWRLEHEQAVVVYLGSPGRVKLVNQLLFDGEARVGALGSRPLWSLRSRIARWLSDGVDLVVCETSAAARLSVEAPIAFRVPLVVNQTLRVPDPPQTVFAGQRGRSLRGRINRAERYGWSYRFTRARRSYRHFYHQMYLPFARARHGELSTTASQAVQRDWWLKGGRGGVLLVTERDAPVAGTLCYRHDGTVYDVESGVLNGDAAYLQKGINAYRAWSVIAWAHAQGARKVNLGGTPGWRSSGAYRFKCEWGARTVPRERLSRHWVMVGRQPTPWMCDRLNAIDFIAAQDGRLYAVRVATSKAAGLDLAGAACERARLEGLAGVLIQGSADKYVVTADARPAAGAPPVTKRYSKAAKPAARTPFRRREPAVRAGPPSSGVREADRAR